MRKHIKEIPRVQLPESMLLNESDIVSVAWMKSGLMEASICIQQHWFVVLGISAGRICVHRGKRLCIFCFCIGFRVFFRESV